MYQVKRAKRIVEELQLLNENDEPEYTLKVDIAPDVFRNRYIEAIKAVQSVNNMGEDVTMEYREAQAKEAILGLYKLVFGEEQTKDLLTYYGGRIYEALEQITPFIYECILPKVAEASDAQKKRLQMLVGGKK